jgi:hypothetical protein
MENSPAEPDTTIETQTAAPVVRRPIFPCWVWLCSFFLAAVILATAWFFVLSAPIPSPGKLAVPLFTVYPAATLTEIPPTPSWTPEISPAPSLPTVRPGSIATGIMVEVSGTGGDGLNLRDAPNTNGKILFRVFEHEVFRIADGPQQSNGYTWWLLQGAIDASRQGWGVENFLRPTGF